MLVLIPKKIIEKKKWDLDIFSNIIKIDLGEYIAVFSTSPIHLYVGSWREGYRIKEQIKAIDAKVTVMKRQRTIRISPKNKKSLLISLDDDLYKLLLMFKEQYNYSTISDVIREILTSTLIKYDNIVRELIESKGIYKHSENIGRHIV